MNKLTKERMKELLKNDRFPRSAKYDPEWVLKGWMGPNVLWLTEWLCEKMDLKPGMRVLDMGCGKALSSVFLAKEYGVKVWANDLWIPAAENWGRIKEAGLENEICPIHAEAHDLPYAEEFFDAIISLDSYQYYGTDDLYLPNFLKFLRPGGQIGVVVAGLAKDFNGPVPEHLARPRANGKPLWVDECWCFHTAAWWQSHWDKLSVVKDVAADAMPDGWKDWLQYEKACDEAGTLMFPSEEPVLREDAGRYLALIRLAGRKKE
ncbi:MAG: methyltransferase domain-containing protein [Dehalococcoidales bacterium]|jgi:SAM-dependent methyltransferase